MAPVVARCRKSAPTIIFSCAYFRSSDPFASQVWFASQVCAILSPSILHCPDCDTHSFNHVPEHCREGETTSDRHNPLSDVESIVYVFKIS